jgi:transcriptional regulator with XRE-family HTH domain
MEFLNEVFAALLLSAKGNRSINKFGEDCGVDPGYISRLSRGLIVNPPSAAIIDKLAKKALNNVSKKEFMIAAGYLESSELDDENKQMSSNTLEHGSSLNDIVKQLNQDFIQDIAQASEQFAWMDKIKAKVMYFKQDSNITELPVNVIDIYKKNKWSLKWTDDLDRAAITFLYNGLFRTYISSFIKTRPQKVREVLGCQIAHIVLGHLKDSLFETVNLEMPSEYGKDAYLFCNELLMPEDFIIENHKNGIDSLQKMFGVSRLMIKDRVHQLVKQDKLHEGQL